MTTAPPKADVFPNTEATWLGDRLDTAGEGLGDALSHVMSVYHEPLAIYLRGCPFRTLGDPEDLVAGFFASRLSRADYLRKWRDSGRPLRRWLITGLRHYLLEEIKRRRRDGVGEVDPELLAQDADDDTPTADFDRAFARRLIDDAVRATEASMACDGLAAHWAVFERHEMRGEPFAALAQTTGETPERLAVMCRVARRRFRKVLRSMVAWPGATPEMIDHEIGELLAR